MQSIFPWYSVLIGESNVAIDPAIGGYGVEDIYLGEFSPHMKAQVRLVCQCEGHSEANRDPIKPDTGMSSFIGTIEHNEA